MNQTDCTNAAIKAEFIGKEDFEALCDAQKFLRERGFSYGSNERGLPTGILYGDFSISKWRNLNSVERSDLHGAMTGDMRHGPVVIEIFKTAPEEAKKAFLKNPIMELAA